MALVSTSGQNISVQIFQCKIDQDSQIFPRNLVFWGIKSGLWVFGVLRSVSIASNVVLNAACWCMVVIDS